MEGLLQQTTVPQKLIMSPYGRALCQGHNEVTLFKLKWNDTWRAACCATSLEQGPVGCPFLFVNRI